jgi:hypothetical protein
MTARLFRRPLRSCGTGNIKINQGVPELLKGLYSSKPSAMEKTQVATVVLEVLASRFTEDKWDSMLSQVSRETLVNTHRDLECLLNSINKVKNCAPFTSEQTINVAHTNTVRALRESKKEMSNRGVPPIPSHKLIVAVTAGSVLTVVLLALLVVWAIRVPRKYL